MLASRQSLWESALADYIESKRTTPFDYASNDCAKFVAGAIEAMTGDRPGVEYLSKYSTQHGSESLLKKSNGLRSICEQLGGPMRTDMLFIRVGDVVMLNHADRLVLAICLGRKAVLPGPNGLVFPDIDQAVGYWRI